MNPQKIEIVNQLLKEYTDLLNKQLPNLDGNLAKDFEQIELQQEINMLRNMLSHPETFEEAFKKHCTSREQETKETIPFYLMPKSFTNQLYWKIAQQVFEPQTMEAILAIVLPNAFDTKPELKQFVGSILGTQLEHFSNFILDTPHYDIENSPDYPVIPSNIALSYWDDSLKAILMTYIEKNQQLATIEAMNKNSGTNDRQVGLPQAFKTLLECVPAEKNLEVFNTTDANGDTMLMRFFKGDRSIYFQLSIEQLLEHLPVSQRLDVINATDTKGNTILRILADRFTGYMEWPEQFSNVTKKILDALPEEHKLSAIKMADNQPGVDTILHKAAKHPPFLKEILALYPQHDILDAIKRKNKQGKTVLEIAAPYPESLRTILPFYPQNEVLDVVKPLLFDPIKNPESLEDSLRLLSPKERLTIIKLRKYEITKEADCFTATIPHHVASQSCSRLKSILELFPEDKIPEILSQTRLSWDISSPKNTVLHDAVQRDRIILGDEPESPFLEDILNYLPKKDLLDLVNTKNKNKDTVLHVAAKTGQHIHPSFLPSLLNALPEAQRLDVLKATNELTYETVEVSTDYWRTKYIKKPKEGTGETALHIASENISLIKEILQLLPEEQRLDALNITNEHNQTVWQSTIVNFLRWNNVGDLSKEWKLLYETLLLILPPAQQLEALKVTDKNGKTILHKICTLDMLEQVLQCLPEEERQDVLKTIHKERITFIETATDTGAYFERLEHLNRMGHALPEFALNSMLFQPPEATQPKTAFYKNNSDTFFATRELSFSGKEDSASQIHRPYT